MGTGAWETEIESYTSWLTASGASPQTLRLKRGYLRRLSTGCHPRGPWTVTTDDLARFVACPTWKPETRKSARNTIRGFYAWAHHTGRIRRNPAVALPPVRTPPAHPRPAPAPIVADALAAADERGRQMILLALLGGLRRAEIAQVHTQDITDDLTGRTLTVHGKGGKTRRVPLHPDLAELLTCATDGYLFPGRRPGTHLHPQHVGDLLARALGPGWGAHSLRHRFATDTYRGSRDIRAVQELLGHAQVSTTQIYVQVPDGDLRAAVLSLPRPRTGLLTGLRRRLHAATV